jgi:cysteine desulfurase family protein (TIGR01976 family)
VSAVALDVDAVRARFSALRQPLAFLDGPGGTQVPDEVVDAMAAYLTGSNANLGGAFETSRRSDLIVAQAHMAAAAFLGCTPGEVGFGANMTSLNFALSRTVGREFRPGDEIVVTRLDHDGNVAPWLELARDRELVVRMVGFHPGDCTLDLDELESALSGRTRIVAFPMASNAVGTIPDARAIVALAHEAGALAWADAVHLAPHRRIDVAEIGADVLLCSPYKFFGPHLGLFYARGALLGRWRPYKVRPAGEPAAGDQLSRRFETGTLAHEALAGFVAAVEYVRSIGWEAIEAHEDDLGRRFLGGLPGRYRLFGAPTMDARTPTFALNHPSLAPAEVAGRLAAQGIAVWSGDYYAVEAMDALGLPEGAVRIGFVHYNTEDEVDRALEALDAL